MKSPESFGGFIADTGKNIKKAVVNTIKTSIVAGVAFAPMVGKVSAKQPPRDGDSKNAPLILESNDTINAGYTRGSEIYKAEKERQAMLNEKDETAKSGHSPNYDGKGKAEKNDGKLAQGW